MRRLGLVVAAVMAAWLLFGPAARTPATSAGTPTVVDASGLLTDGAPFTPWLYLDPATAVGTAPTPADDARRLVLRGPGSERVLRKLDQVVYPQFLGLTRADGFVYWAESTTPTSSSYVTQLWRAPVTGDAPAELVTADTGVVLFANSQFDLLVEGQRLYWAAEPDGGAATEVRSVPVGGGAVTTLRVEGAFALTRWPWLQRRADGGPVLLRDVLTGRTVTVPAAATERLTCGPVWCRSLVTGADGGTVYDLVRSDGTGRRRLGGPAVTAVAEDVVLLDRFEPLYMDVADGATVTQRLVVHDVVADRTVIVADGVSMAVARHGMLWWSTVERGVTTWHVVALSDLIR